MLKGMNDAIELVHEIVEWVRGVPPIGGDLARAAARVVESGCAFEAALIALRNVTLKRLDELDDLIKAAT